MREKRMLKMEWAWDLEDAGNGRGFAQGGTDYQGGADVVGVDYVGLHGLDQGSAGFEYSGDLPGVLGRDVEIYGDYGGACFLIFWGQACRGGGEGDYYFKTQGAEHADLVVDPGCSGGGFDDVQDLHEQRVAMARSLDGCNENNTAKGRGAQSVKVRPHRTQAGLPRCGRQAGRD
jgi:hypothetical protein